MGKVSGNMEEKKSKEGKDKQGSQNIKKHSAKSAFGFIVF
jgi:hypothetical protein